MTLPNANQMQKRCFVILLYSKIMNLRSDEGNRSHPYSYVKYQSTYISNLQSGALQSFMCAWKALATSHCFLTPQVSPPSQHLLCCSKKCCQIIARSQSSRNLRCFLLTMYFGRSCQLVGFFLTAQIMGCCSHLTGFCQAALSGNLGISEQQN